MYRFPEKARRPVYRRLSKLSAVHKKHPESEHV